ncbi:DMT family transporter [Halodesulfovibrio marinisediminis]|uniref:Permease of the drug/metabolite transporter (DMT) superfamily n=1 Tax=Halodesulfovibrio marinisediminis DSM 17456 TaxID=1121457 RepID=A0A1N6J5G5_9BACT|nr:DMT family transporter [Halodesulfovibrio marinisediminis]SIO39540.1 Permease of the drug/metabolite transporter (DMT) superfamily [Halodesulfovibrio marinisediminis DSM 17456]
MITKHSSLLPQISLCAAMTLWASSFVAMKYAIVAFSPMLVVFCRMAIASLVLLTQWHRIELKKIPRAHWKTFAFLVLCEPCLLFIFEAHALKYTSASQAGMICSIVPIFVAVGSYLLYKEKQPRIVWTGFITAIGGVALLSMKSIATETAPNPLLGNFFEMMAMLSATGYILTAKRLCASYSAFTLTALQAWIGTLFFFPILLLSGETIPTNVQPEAVMAILYLGTAVSFGAYLFYNYGLRHVPAAQASAYGNLIPVIALGLGHIILSETLTVLQYAACVFVLAGVWMSQRRTSPKTTENLPTETQRRSAIQEQ